MSTAHLVHDTACTSSSMHTPGDKGFRPIPLWRLMTMPLCISECSFAALATMLKVSMTATYFSVVTLLTQTASYHGKAVLTGPPNLALKSYSSVTVPDMLLGRPY